MPITGDWEIQSEPTVRNLWKSSESCNNVWPADIVNHPVRAHLEQRYSPEHRPKPDNLTRHLTSRDRIRSAVNEKGMYYNITSSPCWHLSHTLEHWASRTNLMPYYYNIGYDIDELKQLNQWVAPLRNRIGSYKVNLGSSLAEYRESAKMFVAAGEGIYNAWQVLRGRMPRRKIRACSIPASVLQFNFGVAPLVNDLYSSIETLRYRMERPIDRRTSISIKRRIGYQGHHPGEWYVSSKGEFKQRATIYYTIDPNQYLSSDFDFGNPVEWAWELIPFSFVVDWAIPIGDWLGSLDALQGVHSIRGTLTTKTSENYTYHPYGFNHIISEGKGSSKSYERDVIDDVPLPPFPAWSPSMSYKRVINAVALLTGIKEVCS